MKALWVVIGSLGLGSAMACTKKPTAEQCDQAWHHVAEILQEMVREDMNRMGAEVPPEARKMMANHMADGLKQVEKTTMGAAIHTAQIEACQGKPLARATCILEANSVEDLVNVCKMKASRGGYRGGLSLSWPE